MTLQTTSSVKEARCQWGGCQESRTQLSRWPNGVTVWHCDEHAEAVRESLMHPDPPQSDRYGVTLAIDLTVTASEMATWAPRRIEQFFAGIAKAVNAKVGMPDDGLGPDPA